MNAIRNQRKLIPEYTHTQDAYTLLKFVEMEYSWHVYTYKRTNEYVFNVKQMLAIQSNAGKVNFNQALKSFSNKSFLKEIQSN